MKNNKYLFSNFLNLVNKKINNAGNPKKLKTAEREIGEKKFNTNVGKFFRFSFVSAVVIDLAKAKIF